MIDDDNINIIIIIIIVVVSIKKRNDILSPGYGKNSFKTRTNTLPLFSPL